MSYNWTSAATPQGRERLKELMDSDKGLIVSTWPMSLFVLSMNDGKYQLLGWKSFDTVDDLLNGTKGLQFLDPNPQPEPNDDAPEGYHIVTFAKDQEKDENGLLPCPFCGEVKYIECGNMYGNTLYKFIVTCKGCGATSCDGETDSEAIAAWNRRAGKEANP